MKKIEDYQLQMYVDNELSQSEMKKVQEFIDTNSEAKSKVDNYKKINNLVIENFRSLETEEIQKKTIDLLLKEDISIINKILNYRIKLVPAFASFAVVLLITISSRILRGCLTLLRNSKSSSKPLCKTLL